jgi:hypothetical protein
MKWGTCQKNSSAKSSQPMRSISPSLAAVPMIGGIAPGSEPTSVHQEVIVLSGV